MNYITILLMILVIIALHKEIFPKKKIISHSLLTFEVDTVFWMDLKFFNACIALDKVVI